MARKSQVVQVGKRKLELSNLDKILYPEDEIVKAEIIQYYLKVAPSFLAHAKNRPLSLVRFPDGIDGERFFQKNRPHWTPDWLEHIQLETQEKTDHILATEEASLVWLANLACLELHQYHTYKPHFETPDYMVFDIDPPEGYSFTDVVEIALNLKDELEQWDYPSFPKTTGGKGVHILVPLELKYTFQQVFEAAKEIAQSFVAKYPSQLTLQIKKEARKGRVLIDIYRIRHHQSIVCAYSLRGRDGAPVSMPLHWEELAEVTDPNEFNLHSVPEKLSSEGDAWEGMESYSMYLHTDRNPVVPIKKELKSDKHKTPEQLEDLF